MPTDIDNLFSEYVTMLRSFIVSKQNRMNSLLELVHISNRGSVVRARKTGCLYCVVYGSHPELSSLPNTLEQRIEEVQPTCSAISFDKSVSIEEAVRFCEDKNSTALVTCLSMSIPIDRVLETVVFHSVGVEPYQLGLF